MKYASKYRAADGFDYTCEIDVDEAKGEGTIVFGDTDGRPAHSFRGLPISELRRLGREITTACEAADYLRRRAEDA